MLLNLGQKLAFELSYEIRHLRAKEKGEAKEIKANDLIIQYPHFVFQFKSPRLKVPHHPPHQPQHQQHPHSKASSSPPSPPT
jgi:hypothetical protein